MSATPPDYTQLSHDELAELAQHGDPQAGAEIISRAQAAPGAVSPTGNEEIGPSEMPAWQGPGLEPPDYRSGKTRLNPGDIDRLAGFNTTARIGDNLEGHEILQHAFLVTTGQSTSRTSGPASRGNPSIAVDPQLHDQIDRLQVAAGLHDKAQLATMTPTEIIDKNC